MSYFKRNNQQLVLKVPKHIAIVMDGNGRWAKKRLLPRFIGHKKGLQALEKTVELCVKYGVRYLTVFAFSTENWKRPKLEIDYLMGLFLKALDIKVKELHQNNIHFKFIGSLVGFSDKIVAGIKKGEELTRNNTALTLIVAANYGGRWDIVNAVNQLIASGCSYITEENIKPYLSLSEIEEPDLYIRTGGEIRISNFLLWQMAYTEFYFTDTLWPDFDETCLLQAIESFQTRERRFGKTSEQLPQSDRRE